MAKKGSQLTVRTATEIQGGEFVILGYAGRSYQMTLDELKKFIGIIEAGGGSVDLTQVSTDILPLVDASKDIGSLEKRWKKVYSTALTVKAQSVDEEEVNIHDGGIEGKIGQDIQWSIDGNGRANFYELTVNGADVATMDYVNNELLKYVTTDTLTKNYVSNTSLAEILKKYYESGYVDYLLSSKASTGDLNKTNVQLGIVQTDVATLKSYFQDTDDVDDIINKWRELEAFLAGQTETSTLAELLSVKADKSTVAAINSRVTDLEDADFVDIDSLRSTLESYYTKEQVDDLLGETGYINEIAASGAGNGIASVSKDGSKLTFTKANFLTDATVPAARTLFYGGIKIGYKDNGKNYGVILDDSGKAYVNVPWESYDLSKFLEKAGGSVNYLRVSPANSSDSEKIDIGVTTNEISGIHGNGVVDWKINSNGAWIGTNQLATQSWANSNFHPLTTVDTAPTLNSSNLVTSGGVAKAVADLAESADSLYQGKGNYLTSSSTLSSANLDKNTITIAGASVSLGGSLSTNTLATSLGLSSYQPKITTSNKLAYSLISGAPTSLPASDVYAWAKASTKPSYAWNEIGSKPTFATVATSGSYSDLSNKPVIPNSTTVSAWGYITEAAVIGKLADYLPLTGGLITSSAVFGLKINYTGTSSYMAIPFYKDNTMWGALGMRNDTPIFINAANSQTYNLIHSGNIGSQSVLNSSQLEGRDSSEYMRTSRIYSTSNSNIDDITGLGLCFNATGNGSGNSNFPDDYGLWLNMPWTPGERNYRAQMHFGTNKGLSWRMFFDSAATTSWRTIIDTYNISAYAVTPASLVDFPRLNGTSPSGASATGTWDISIHGSARRLISPYYYTGDETRVIHDSTTSDELFGGHYSFSAMMKNNSLFNGWATVWNFSAYERYGGTQFSVLYNSQPVRAALRTYSQSSNGWGDWREIAFTDSTVAAANKLSTARTIWGQSFDGSGNVSGDIHLWPHNLLGNSDATIINTEGNWCYIGAGTATKGWPTYVDGDTIYLRYGTSHTTGLILNSSGNVTIGSSDLAGSTEHLNVAEILGIEGDSKDARLKISEESASVNYIHLYVASNTAVYPNSRPLVLQNGYGNVGIGTTNPHTKLHVVGDAKIEGALSTVGGGLTIDTSNSDIAITHRKGSTKLWTMGNYNGCANFSDALYVQSGSTPTRVATVNDLSSYLPKAGGEMANGSRISHGGDMYIGRADSTGWVGLQDICSQSFLGDRFWSIRINGAARFQSIMCLSTTGSHIIGNSNSEIIFQPSNDTSGANIPLKIAKTGSSTYTMYCDESEVYDLGTSSYKWNILYCRSASQSSDATLKNILGNVELTTAQIANAPAVNFTWKNGGTKDVGTIAQYWKNVLPEVVSGEEGSYGMNYAVLGVVSSIILARNIETHEQRIARLEKEISNLQKELNALVNNE